MIANSRMELHEPAQKTQVAIIAAYIGRYQIYKGKGERRNER
jgi:hypothetical protein